MHKLTFYHLGNADCCRIDLAGGEKLLFDYADTRCRDDDSDLRADLPALLREDLDAAGREGYDVVAFTHLDDDHVCGAGDFFFLEHAAKYQGDDRARIDELWVPAGAITEDGCCGDARIIQQEARHRLVQGRGIRVFSRPGALEAWLKTKNLTLAERAHLITDAGQLVPGWDQYGQGVEFFIHSPFAWRQDGQLFDRNTDALVLQAVFQVDGVQTKLILGSDVDYEALTAIAQVTKAHKRPERLEWDVFKLPHHCSYLSLGPERGVDRTEPVPEVEWIFETQAQHAAVAVSSSKPIPSDDDDDQPPHRQAANYHKDTKSGRTGEFIVTMEHPKVSAPAPLVIKIDRYKATVEKGTVTVGRAAVTVAAPRAGAGDVPHRLR